MQGDVVWIDFNPQIGHEQGGRRPALVLSSAAYNRRVGLALFCPITSHIKGYPFEVLIPQGYAVKGALLADQVKSMDWTARNTQFLCTLPISVLTDVLGKIIALMQG